MIQGLRTAVYKVADLEKAKAWYSDVLGIGNVFGIIENPHFKLENAG